MNLVSIFEASKWASSFLNKEVLPTNISYLVQYGKVKKHGENGSTEAGKLVGKKGLETLVDSLGENIINYHPENYYQERSTLLNCSNMLRKYGLTDEGVKRLDFC